MDRKIEHKLVEWAESSERQPLLLQGARQVGKSYLLDWLGETYFENTVHVNLETQLSIAKMFDGDINPQKIVHALESVSGVQIKPHKLQNIKIYQHEHLPQAIQLRDVYPDFKEELRMHGRHHVCAMLRRFLHLIKKRLFSIKTNLPCPKRAEF